MPIHLGGLIHAGLFNIDAFESVTCDIAIHPVSYLFILTTTALDSISTETKYTANILGAGAMRTASRSTLPVARPASTS